MPTPLDTFLAETCKEHNLSSASVAYFPDFRADNGFTVYFHWEGSSTRGYPCASGEGASIAEAARNAAIEMEALRIIPAPQLEAVS